MTHWSENQYQEYMSKLKSTRQSSLETKDIPDQGPESKLQARVLNWCSEHGYPVFHDRSRRKNIRGWPDLTICLPDGIVLFIELKSAKGVLRSEQVSLKLQMDYLKQRYHVVKSFKRFLEIINANL